MLVLHFVLSDTGTTVIEEVVRRVDDTSNSVQKLARDLQQIKRDLELVGRHFSGHDKNDDDVRER